MILHFALRSVFCVDPALCVCDATENENFLQNMKNSILLFLYSISFSTILPIQSIDTDMQIALVVFTRILNALGDLFDVCMSFAQSFIFTINPCKS